MGAARFCMRGTRRPRFQCLQGPSTTWPSVDPVPPTGSNRRAPTSVAPACRGMAVILPAVDHRLHWLLVVLFLLAFLRVMEASIGDSCTVGEPGACCWLRWGLGHGLLFHAVMEDWAPLDRFFHSNHSCSGRSVAFSPLLPEGHAPGCRSALPAASRR